MAGKNQHVVKRDDGWAVRGAGNQRDTSHHRTQSEAERAARDIAINQRHGGEWSCASCHGGHDILKISDRRAAPNKLNMTALTDHPCPYPKVPPSSCKMNRT